jgi:uncharacterized protein (DUF2252 family)
MRGRVNASPSPSAGSQGVVMVVKAKTRAGTRTPAKRTGPATSGRRRRPAKVEHLSRAERVARGKEARVAAPLESHAAFEPPSARDPVGLLLEQSQSRVPELVPIRYGRMLVSPFAFYRGAALPMAADLAAMPSSGLTVQLCGDAHLSNFGAFASPARRLVFDINDFDETLPGPFEWDVKRLAASLAVAGRDNGFSRKARRRITVAGVESYHRAMREFAGRPRLDVWYAHLEVEPTLRQFAAQMTRKHLQRVEDAMSKARTRDSLQALAKLTTVVDGKHQIINTPPTIVPAEDVFTDMQADALYKEIETVLARYRRSLQSDRRRLLEHFTLVQVARKVVGVGSVGTRAWILLLDGGDGDEPLFLQAKEADTSVLARFSGASRYDNQGERVVAGQHLMQAESDIFLGWARVDAPDGQQHDYYVRQLRDWKYSVPIEQARPRGMALYAQLCGWTLARAHARSGDRFALAAYLGNKNTFAHAIADFAETYADQNDRDYAAFDKAVREHRVEAEVGV